MRSDPAGFFQNHPDWGRITSLIAKNKRVALLDMAPMQRLLAAAALAGERPVIYLLPNERLARQAAEDAAQLTALPSAYFPQMEPRFLRAIKSREEDWQRLRALDHAQSGELKLLIASAETLQQRMPPPEWFSESVFDIKPGLQLDPQETIGRLANLAYERVDLVEGKGQFALRGDIMDVYPPGLDTPVRVEFFDVEVDTLREFDPLTQRSAWQLEGVRITPALEGLIPKNQRAAIQERLQAVFEQEGTAPGGRDLPVTDFPFDSPLPDLESLLTQGSFDGMQQWAHLIYPPESSLIDWMPGALIVVDTPDRAMQRLEEAGGGYARMLTEAIASGSGSPLQEGLLRTRDEAQALLSGRKVLTVQEMLRGMGGLKPDQSFSLSGTRPESYRGRLRALAEDLLHWKDESITTFLFTGGKARSERLASSLLDHGLAVTLPGEQEEPAENLLRIVPNGLSEGFLFPGGGLHIIAPEELFGKDLRKARKTATAGQRIEAFTDLMVGDYVVHEHHGIGIYQGTVRLQSEGVWRDYLYIQYQGSDKLYVPTDQFDRVQKYIGSPDAKPALNDLSSNAWSQQKSRVKSGLKQLAFDLVQLYAGRHAAPGYAFEPFEPFESQFADQFEYELTPDQEQAVIDVLSDMAKPQNMDRLLCGDVGYGKTEVAIRAAFRAVMNGKQVAMLAPTTILVQQHVRTMIKRFEGMPVHIAYISRFRTPKKNKETLAQVKAGKVDILIGTHRLLSKDVSFKDLGLLIIDEEQRFGVRHKELIKNYKQVVDVLTLSATPIPRTLHMSLVGVRDMSLLETPPEERFPVTTYVVDYDDSMIRDAIMREISRDGQVFFLYNRVSDIERMATKLRRLVPEASIAVAHGQMPERALEDVMMDFYNGAHDVLLCSTIIENGLDIQNANTLIVYDADHFGLSQLYQLRGRVGRSSRSAYAFFTVRPDKMMSETAKKRLTAIKEFTAFGSGFRIAMRDLEIRGAGNIFGPEQSGQVAAVGYDMYVKMIEEAIKEAQGDFSSLRESELETRVDLHVNAYLPETYVQGEPLRIEIYKRIALLRTEEDQQELFLDLVDRFGEPPEPVVNLIHIARLRALANALGCDQARYDNEWMLLRFNPQYAVDPARLYKAVTESPHSLSLTSGKRTSLAIKLPGKSAQEALFLSIGILTALEADIKEKEASADGA